MHGLPRSKANTFPRNTNETVSRHDTVAYVCIVNSKSKSEKEKKEMVESKERPPASINPDASIRPYSHMPKAVPIEKRCDRKQHKLQKIT